MHSSYPTRSQKRTLWIALTALATVTIGAIAVGAIWLGTWVLGYLQPLLIPFAVAGVLAYLLYPLVRKLKDRGMESKKAGTLVFVAFMVLAGALMTFVVSTGIRQAAALNKELPDIKKKVGKVIDEKSEWIDKWVDRFGGLVPKTETGIDVEGSATNALPADTAEAIAQKVKEAGDSAQGQTVVAIIPPDVTTTPGTSDSVETDSTDAVAVDPADGTAVDSTNPDDQVDLLKYSFTWLYQKYPELYAGVLKFLRSSVGGFLGTAGFVLGFLVVPIYLFFFLREAVRIQESWSDYLPIRASRFKNEMVATLKEINNYLIAFFRGQMLVSLIDGLITAILLSAIGLKFGLLIGLLVGFLGIIPFIGILICFLPALAIAIAQGASGEWAILGIQIEDPAIWTLPLVVTIVFVAVNNLDGIFIAPKIVGDSVGLHPFTIIFSVLFWSTLLGGLLGSILAVPLTASIKVLFTRYVWEKRLRPGSTVGGALEEPAPKPVPDPEPAT